MRPPVKSKFTHRRPEDPRVNDCVYVQMSALTQRIGRVHAIKGINVYVTFGPHEWVIVPTSRVRVFRTV